MHLTGAADAPVPLAGAAAHLLAEVGRIAVPKGRWRYANPGGEIGRTIGARRPVSLLATVGVLQQTLIADACRAIAEGETDVALVVGGDAGYRLLRARIAGTSLADRQQDDAPDVVLAPKEELRHPAELRAGMKMPVGLYAIMESAYRARQGWSVDDHRDRLARMYSRFSEIAADNPHAWNRRRLDAATIRDASERNPMQAFPYTRLHCATWNVDQAGALLFCSEARADALGIAPDKRVHPRASTESNHMVPVSGREDLAGCPGAGIAGRKALDAAGLGIGEVDLVDLYTCFPIAVETYAAELGLPSGRDSTLTGSMAYAGGPFNNYVLQATCRAAQLLRAGQGRHALVASVSGVLTKQGFGVWSRTGSGDGYVHRDVSNDVARAVATRTIVESARGHGVVVGCTVLHAPGEAPRGVAVVEVDGDGTRTVVETRDPALVARLETEEFCGTRVRLGEAYTFAP